MKMVKNVFSIILQIIMIIIPFISIHNDNINLATVTIDEITKGNLNSFITE